MNRCATCGGGLQAHEGPGRPSVYCGDPCRRIAEFRIRALTRRIERYELEQREVKFEIDPVDDVTRERRLRALRAWIKRDSAQLRAVLGGNNQKQEQQ